MSSDATTKTPPPSSSSSRLLTPTTKPIATSREPIAVSYSRLYPALVLAHFYIRFPSVVADPVAALTRDLLPLALAQAAYCVICLPAAGASTKSSKGAAKESGKDRNREKDEKERGRGRVRERERERAKARDGGGIGAGGGAALVQRVSTALLSFLLTTFSAIPLLFIILVLFGAPLTTHHAQTILCAAHMALLAAPPLFYVHGMDPSVWREIACFWLPGDEVWGGTVGALVGAWLGAVPIPLDWDREWQKWPVTIVTGVYLGWAVGRLAGEFIFYGKRIPTDP